jgi:hypothetical protein
MKLLIYYRCHDCLTAFTSYEDKVDECACGGPVEKMGRVHKDEVIDDKVVCACDARCTHASGPSCNCGCGGVNHGTGKLVVIMVVMGKNRASQIDAGSLRRADEFKAAKASAMARLEKIFTPEDIQKAQNRQWFTNSWAIQRHLSQVRHASSLKVHKMRINRLNALFL